MPHKCRDDAAGPVSVRASRAESHSVPADLPQSCGTVSRSVQPAGRTPVFVEVFGGLARLSKAARDRGFSCAPIDHANKASGIKVLHIDLCGQAGRSLLKGVLENPDVRWVHWAPPCGTFSRAREVRRQGGPLPLRNLSFVTGFRYLPRLSDRVRVKRANSLVELMTTWCRALSARGVCWSIENPSNSLIWAYPGLRELVQAAHVVHFDACMFGSRRKKATAIVSNRTWFRRSGVRCSGDHPHESWGKARSAGRTVWATSLESACTPELSRAWVSCVATALSEELSAAPPTRRRKRKFLCEPDFDDRVILHADEAVPFMQMFPPCRVPKSMTKWPKGSRLLFLDESAGSAHLAVPCPPEIWCRRAADLAHPYSMDRPLHADLNSAVSAETVSDPAALARKRTEECKSLSILCKSVEAEEMACRAGLRPDVQSVTSTKQSPASARSR